MTTTASHCCSVAFPWSQSSAQRFGLFPSSLKVGSSASLSTQPTCPVPLNKHHCPDERLKKRLPLSSSPVDRKELCCLYWSLPLVSRRLGQYIPSHSCSRFVWFAAPRGRLSTSGTEREKRYRKAKLQLQPWCQRSCKAAPQLSHALTFRAKLLPFASLRSRPWLKAPAVLA